jgi:hypothetical protein
MNAITGWLSINDCPGDIAPNHTLEPTAANALRALAVPLSLRSSAAAWRDRRATQLHGIGG